MRPYFKLLNDLKFNVLNVQFRLWIVDSDDRIGDFIGIKDILFEEYLHLEHAHILATVDLAYRQFLSRVNLKLNWVLMDHKNLFVLNWLSVGVNEI